MVTTAAEKTEKVRAHERDSFDLDGFVQNAREQYNWHRTEMAKLEKLISAVEPTTRAKAERVGSFKDWTIPQCAKQLILEEGHSLTTRQILDKMQERGWTSSSARPITVVHSGLAETPYITRVGKRWDLSDLGASTEF
jgi:hypothetical protein